MPNSVHLHRVLAARPDKVYRAFLEPDALAKWLSPNGFACTVHKLEPAVGGSVTIFNYLLRDDDFSRRRTRAPTGRRAG